MQIIDRNRDYYDHYSQVYGVDKRATFDRRGSVQIDDMRLVELAIPSWERLDYFNRDPYWTKIHIESPGYFLLEVGTSHTLIKVSDVHLRRTNDAISSVRVKSLQLEVAHVYENTPHKFNTPISLRGVDMHPFYRYPFWRIPGKKNELVIPSFEELLKKVFVQPINIVDLPILKGTSITKVLNPEKIWRDLQNYLLSLLNDKDIDLSMTDVEKAEVHGFDKKTSFRHPVKL